MSDKKPDQTIPPVHHPLMMHRLRKIVQKLLDALNQLKRKELSPLSFRIGQIELLRFVETERPTVPLKGVILNVCDQIGSFLPKLDSTQDHEALRRRLEDLLSCSGANQVVFTPAKRPPRTPPRPKTMESQRMAQADLSSCSLPSHREWQIPTRWIG